MAEPQAVYRIVRWAELYELPKREQGGDGPLKYVRAWVHGHSVDEAYRLLFSIAPDVAAAAYGLFSRLRDIAADEPRKHRDGTIRYRQHRPATVPDIAFMTLFPADLVGRCLELLCHPDIQWIERVTAADATDAEQPPTHDATATRRRRDGDATDAGRGPSIRTGNGDGDRNGDGDKDGDKDGDGNTTTPADVTPSSKQDPMPDVPVPDFSDGGFPDSIPSQDGHAGAKQAMAMRIKSALRIDVPEKGDKSRFAQQRRADATTVARILDHVVNSADITEARRQARPVLTLAYKVKHRPPEQRMKAFVGECKEKWPTLFRERPEVVHA